MSRETLGDFEHQVLLAVLRLGGESYSVPVVLELEERTGREIAQAAVFIVMSRLEKKGLLESRIEGATESETGRARRYFALTSLAIQRLRESRNALVRLWDGVEAKLDEA